MKTSLHLPTIAGFSLLLIAQALPAQTPAEKSDEIVKLSEFSVSADTGKSYIASETMSGSRVAAAIKDLPFALEVTTAEFMKDFGAFEGSTASFAYTSAITAVDLSGTGNSIVRGYSSQYMLRDGFFRLGRTDPIIIDRIEFIKGPSVGSIYGETQPGGIINMITKRPTLEPRGHVAFTAGSYGTDREEAIATGPVPGAPNTYYLVAASDFERHYEMSGPTLRNRSAAVGLEHKFASGGDLYVLTTTWRGQGHTTPSNVPYYYNSATKTYVGVDMDLATLNQNGPQSETTREASDVTATFDQRLNNVFSVRAAANIWHSKKWSFNVGTGTQYDYTTNALTRGAPTKGLINEDGGGIQADLVAHVKPFNGQADNKTLLTFDFSDYYRFQPTWVLNSNLQITNTLATPAPGAPGTYWFKNIFPGQSVDYSVPAFSPASYKTLSTFQKNRSSIFGGLLRDQLSLFGDRLMLFGTLRYDYVVFNLNSFIGGPTGTGLLAHGTSSALSPSTGFNYKVTPMISVFASRSNGFNANAQNQTATNVPAIQPNQRSWGYDYGLKANLLKDRLFFTVGGYYTVLRNVPDTEVLPNGTTITNFTGSELSRGVDVDLTWRTTDNLTLIGGYGHNNTIYTYFGRDTGAVGFAPRLVPHDQGGLAAKYAFTGELKGFSINGGVSYTAKAPAENPNTGDLFNSAGVYIGNDGRRKMMLPSYTLVDFDVHYRFGEGKIKHTVSVFLKNALDKKYIAYLTSQTVASDRRGIYVSYELSY